MSYIRYWLVISVVMLAMAFYDEANTISGWLGALFAFTVGALLAWIMNKPLKDGRKLAKLDAGRLQVLGLWERSKRANYDWSEVGYERGYREGLWQATRLMAKELARK